MVFKPVGLFRPDIALLLYTMYKKVEKFLVFNDNVFGQLV
jgi:hypothetical protein